MPDKMAWSCMGTAQMNDLLYIQQYEKTLNFPLQLYLCNLLESFGHQTAELEYEIFSITLQHRSYLSVSFPYFGNGVAGPSELVKGCINSGNWEMLQDEKSIPLFHH